MNEYAKEISKIPLLTEEETRELLILVANGNEQARNKLITHNMKIVVKIAYSYATSIPLPLDELISIGSIGLINAIDNFDLTKGLKLSTLVYACVNNEFNKYLKFMKREKRDTSNDISLQEAIYKNKNDEELTLETRIEDSSIVIEDDILDSIRDETLKQVLGYLTKEEQKILLLHYGLVDGICYSFAEIGEKFNLSSERIRQKEMLALKRLRHPRITKKIKDFW